jgi:ATP-dependent RNA helicase RhlE
MVPQSHKRDLVSHLVKANDWKQVLIFTRTKHGANRLAEKLVKDGIEAAAIHGNKSQGARTKALANFKDGSVRVLVATDIAARGLDIDQLPQVVNFELPNVPEDYVHRIGRTGRAGSSGAAVSLVDREELKLLKDIEKLIKREIPRVQVEGFTPNANPEPEAPRAPRPQHGQKRKPQNNGQAASSAPKAQNRPAPQNKPTTSQSKPMSEAARHQAMPQPALFSPTVPSHGNRPRSNTGANPSRPNGGGFKGGANKPSGSPGSQHRSGGRGR